MCRVRRQPRRGTCFVQCRARASLATPSPGPGVPRRTECEPLPRGARPKTPVGRISETWMLGRCRCQHSRACATREWQEWPGVGPPGPIRWYSDGDYARPSGVVPYPTAKAHSISATRGAVECISFLSRVGFYVEQHNAHVPHSAFRGQTPDEMYFGTEAIVPDQLAEQRGEARRRRLAANKDGVRCARDGRRAGDHRLGRTLRRGGPGSMSRARSPGRVLRQGGAAGASPGRARSV